MLVKLSFHSSVQSQCPCILGKVAARVLKLTKAATVLSLRSNAAQQTSMHLGCFGMLTHGLVT